jgi:hypothetical protein
VGVTEQDRLQQAEWLKKTGVTPAMIRAWAFSKGYKIGDRARIPKHVMEQYVEDNRRVVELPPAVPRPRRRTLASKRQVIHLDLAPGYIGKGWRITKHAAERAKELGFDCDELLDAAVYPEVAYGQGERGEGEAIHRKGDVTVGVNEQDKIVKTVVLTTKREWEHGSDVRGMQ